MFLRISTCIWVDILRSRLTSFLSARISAFIDFTEALLDAVVAEEDDEGDDVPAEDEVPTVGVAALVPELEEDPVDAAKAFPETRSPTRTVAMPAFPMAMEIDFFDSFRIRLAPCFKVDSHFGFERS
ncbi:MAG: hypothetical protein ACYDAM_03650 [Leptospirales bacterium]